MGEASEEDEIEDVIDAGEARSSVVGGAVVVGLSCGLMSSTGSAVSAVEVLGR